MSDTEPEEEEMAETADKLDSALDSTDDGTDQQSGDGNTGAFVESVQRGLRDGLLESLGNASTESTESGLGEQFGRLLGEMVVRKLAEQIRGMQTAGSDPAELIEREVDGESLSETVADDFLSGATDDIEDGRAVIEETGELLETADLSELPEAIDMSEVPEAVDTEEVPAAIANAEPERAVELTQLASLIEFDDLWEAVDVREFMQNKDELEDAVGDVTDEDSTDESSLTDSLGSSDSSAGGGGGESLVAQGEAMQAAIQSKLLDSVEEFRENVLDAREQVKEARDTAQETVEKKTGGGTRQPSSRNPTAYSTMVSGWQTSGWSSANFSTVPQTPQHSSAPGHFRIYGQRFENREDGDE